ncbi:hypothetical protein GH733_009863 [Mirounga leonina]|nr:hypothetical protein GH733_009863 [Mirounga leonina]
MHLQASYTYLSLGFSLDHDDAAPEGIGHFCRRAWRGCCILFPVAQEPPEDERGKTLYTMEAAVVLEKNLNQVLGSACPWFYLRRCPSL